MKTPSPSSESPAPREATAPLAPSFGKLARRITAVATNLLLTAIVLVVLIAAGREVIRLWRAPETPPLSAVISSSSTASDQPGSTFLGVSDRLPPLELSILRGDRAAAVAQLAKMGIAAAKKRRAVAPTEMLPAERALLARCEQVAPLVHDGAASAYEVPGDLPQVLVVSDHQLVFCGIGLARGDNAWSLYGLTLQATQQVAGFDKIPLPPDTSRVLSLANSTPVSTLVFVGVGPPQVWQTHYEAWFHQEKWQLLQPWQRQGEVWQAAYGDPASPGSQIVLQFSPAAERQGWHGLLILTTATTHLSE